MQLNGEAGTLDINEIRPFNFGNGALINVEQAYPQNENRPAWPRELEKESFCGLAGEIVHALDPHTEADPAALLTNLLVAFGNVIGNGPHWCVNGGKQPLRLNAVLVGETSKGRKGTSWEPIRALFQQIDPAWAGERVQSGLGSGEGLIWAVRDPIVERQPVKEKGRLAGYQEVEVDPGISDKRFLDIEEEFGRMLKTMARDGNILSAVVRQAWDSGHLRVITKNTPAKATGAHISIIGHITRDELCRYLTDTDAASGFANRFVWVMARRSKVLPEGGQLSESQAALIANRLGAAVEFAMSVGELKRDEAARVMWGRVYGHLSEGKHGLIGSILSRSEAQVMRIACLYALLDRSHEIRDEHLLAALAFWKRAEASVHYIFGSLTGDSLADRIIHTIRGNQKLSRTDISNLFQRNVPKERLDAALATLEHLGLAKCIEINTGGRPGSYWESVAAASNGHE